MPKCHPIALLELDNKSKQGIKRIQQLKASARLGSLILAGGKIADILYRNKPSTQFRNISTTDWELFFKALQGFSGPYARAIEQEAWLQVMNHPTDRAQSTFWKGIA